MRQALAGEAASAAPWDGLLAAVRARGERVRGELEERAAAELELLPSRDRKRAETEWGERIRRARRRVETGALELALDLVETWLLDLVALAFGAADSSGTVIGWRAAGGRGAWGVAPTRGACAARWSSVEDTRQRFQLNVSEDLALRGADLPARAGAGGVVAGLWHRVPALTSSRSGTRAPARVYLRTPRRRTSGSSSS